MDRGPTSGRDRLMVDWREIKRAKSRVVHETMRYPALYIAPGAEPLAVEVRLHTKFAPRDVSGVGEGFAAMLDQTPRAIFKRSEVETPVRGSILSVAVGEAYRLGAARPPDDQYITVEIAALAPGETDDLPVP